MIMKKTMIEVKDVHKIFQMGETKVEALRGVSLKIREGDFAFIVGPSGSGKTTLLDIMGALSKPTHGRVLIDGKDLSRFNDFQLSMLRRKRIGFIFQAFNLVPTLTALENVLLSLEPDGITDEHRKKAEKLLNMVGLEHRIHHRPSQLSGGETQRVAIARALINDPVVIVADEPTGELDHKNGHEIFNYMRKMNEKTGQTFIIVTHDLSYIKKGDIVHQIHDGKMKDGLGRN